MISSFFSNNGANENHQNIGIKITANQDCPVAPTIPYADIKATTNPKTLYPSPDLVRQTIGNGPNINIIKSKSNIFNPFILLKNINIIGESCKQKHIDCIINETRVLTKIKYHGIVLSVI